MGELAVIPRGLHPPYITHRPRDSPLGPLDIEDLERGIEGWHRKWAERFERRWVGCPQEDPPIEVEGKREGRHSW
jgi:hypothetical protein